MQLELILKADVERTFSALGHPAVKVTTEPYDTCLVADCLLEDRRRYEIWFDNEVAAFFVFDKHQYEIGEPDKGHPTILEACRAILNDKEQHA